jgi:hypothetical protein
VREEVLDFAKEERSELRKMVAQTAKELTMSEVSGLLV